MLDANHCIYLIKKAPESVPQTALQDCFISAIVLGELEYGVANSNEERRDQNKPALIDFLSAVRVLPVTEEVSEIYGQARASLKNAGQSIGPNDMWIAAHALAPKLSLMTNNTREFSRVAGLVIDTWIKRD